jgi:GNAT superfamily N-acetyltransferase
MIVRDARPSDCVRLTELALESKAFWGYDDAFMAACRDELTVTPAALDWSRVRVAVHGSDIVGFHGVTNDDVPELAWLFVAPSAMRAGIGRVLLDDASAIARSQGASCLRIEADPNAEPFYLARGAHRIGEVPSSSVSGRTLPLLELDLSSSA